MCLPLPRARLASPPAAQYPRDGHGQTERSLPPRSRLLLYTDGLVERRRISITDRLGTLADVAVDTSLHGCDRRTDLCARILAQVASPAEREDDLCLLAVQTR